MIVESNHIPARMIAHLANELDGKRGNVEEPISGYSRPFVRNCLDMHKKFYIIPPLIFFVKSA